jgi:HEAT repeat protein
LSSETPPPTPPEEDDYADRSGGGRLLVQFFLVPLLVVAVCVGVFFLFSMLTFERKSPSDYLSDIRSGSANQRWQSAFELSRAVAKVRSDDQRRRLGRETLAIFESLHPDRPQDREVQRYLALVLGRLRYAPAAPALERAAAGIDSETRLYSVWALGMLGNRSATPLILQASSSEDAGERKMAAYVLGKLGDPRAVPRLKAMTGDPAADVRWNAAVALAELGDASSRDVLESMLDRASIERQAPGIKPSQTEDAILNALKAVTLIRDKAALPAIQRLEMKDSDMKVRDAARSARLAIEAAP